MRVKQEVEPTLRRFFSENGYEKLEFMQLLDQIMNI
jgi:hypothetical protein